MSGAVAMARFWDSVEMNDEDECWRWSGGLNHNGYGRFTADGARWLAHRFAYSVLVGVIPEGLDLDHLCRRRECVNPAHLEPVTRQENLRRGDSLSSINRRKTHCKRGHAFTEENTRTDARGRTCRTCHRERERARYRRAVAT